MPKRNQVTTSEKAQIALEILQEEKTVNQIASEYGMHLKDLYRWMKQAFENLPKLFEDENKGECFRQAEHERQASYVTCGSSRLRRRPDSHNQQLVVIKTRTGRDSSPQPAGN